MRRGILFACLLMAYCAPALYAQSARSIDAIAQVALRKAQKLQLSGQYRAAEQLLQASLAELGSRADSGHAAGALELLTAIYRDSGRYGEALKTGLRCQRLLERLDNADGALIARRQQVALLLAEVYNALEQYPEANQQLQQALALPGGARKSDPLWEPRLLATQARIAHAMAQEAAAERLWKSAESQLTQWLAHLRPAELESANAISATQLSTEALLATGRAPRAIANLQQRLAQHKANDEVSAGVLLELATCYGHQHDDANEKKTLLAARALYDKKPERRSTVEYADLLDRLALVQQRLRETADAAKLWKQAAGIYAALAKQAGVDERGEAEQMRQFQNLQRVYQRLAEWPDAIRVTERLLHYRQRTQVADDAGVYRAKLALGAFYAKTDNASRARPLLEESLVFWRSRKPPALTELAAALNNLAEVARSGGAVSEALEYLNQALPVFDRLYAADDLKLAELRANLASVLAAKGQYSAAIEHYRRAAEICRGAQRSGALADDLLSTTLLNTAMLYKSQRQFREAARLCQEAYEVRRQATPENEAALLPFFLALASLHLAQDQSHVGGDTSEDVRAARQYVQRARAVCEREHLLGKSAGATLRQLEGSIHLRSGEPQQAKDAWYAALKIAQATGQIASQAKTLNYLAEAELRSGGWEQAEELSRQALQLHAAVQAYPNMQFMAYLNKAQAARLLGHRDEAMQSLEQAIRQIEAPRAATVGAESERAEFFSQFSAAFDLLVDWNVHDQRFEEALGAAEMGRNRTFLDQVRASGIDFRDSLRGTPQEHLLHEERDALAAYNRLFNQLRRARDSAAAPEDSKQVLVQLDDQRNQCAQIQTAIRDASPLYRNLLGSNRQAASWSAIAPKVLAPDNVLLLYYLGHLRSHLFVIDGRTGNVRQFPLEITPEQSQQLGAAPGPLTREVGAQLVNACLVVLRDGNAAAISRGLGPRMVASKKGSGDFSVPPRLRAKQRIAMTEVLLPPQARTLVEQLKPEYVVVAPDGALHQLPLESLLLADEPPKYLFDVFPPITYAPSTAIIAILAERGGQRSDGAVSLLSVGDPHYAAAGQANSRTGEIVSSGDFLALGGQLSPLPATLEECRSVLRSIESSGPANAVLLTGAEATEKNVREQIRGRRFVHLAAHGLIDQQHENLFAAIALTTPEEIVSSEDDGFLSLYEIHSLALNQCEVVVLSACETNVGADRPLEAGSTLARAFLAAGARNVISSHWSVDDASTAALVEEFFQQVSAELKQGQSPHYARALQAARRRVRENPLWSAPYYWAPFVSIGPAK